VKKGNVKWPLRESGKTRKSRAGHKGSEPKEPRGRGGEKGMGSILLSMLQKGGDNQPGLVGDGWGRERKKQKGGGVGLIARMRIPGRRPLPNQPWPIRRKQGGRGPKSYRNRVRGKLLIMG